jgi:hypothetical protein
MEVIDFSRTVPNRAGVDYPGASRVHATPTSLSRRPQQQGESPHGASRHSPHQNVAAISIEHFAYTVPESPAPTRVFTCGVVGVSRNLLIDLAPHRGESRIGNIVGGKLKPAAY